LIESSLDLIAKIREKIDEIRNEIEARIKFRQDDLEIAMSVPGIDFLSASTILAEIGDYRDFNTQEQLASYFGLVPFVNQSGTKQRNGCITKHGSKHLRRILVQVAHAASKKIGSKLRKFYLRIRAKKGANVAIIALARKILCILHHLLTKRELYEEDGIERSKPIMLDRTSSPREMTVQEMIDVIRQSGYTITKIDQGACG
jgi:transposase